MGQINCYKTPASPGYSCTNLKMYAIEGGTGNFQVQFSSRDLHTPIRKIMGIEISTGIKGVCLCKTKPLIGTDFPLAI